MKYLLLLVMLCFPTYAYAEQKEVLCIIGEAEGEGYTGMLAVAEAIRNRGTLKGVYGCNAPRVRDHKYSQEVLETARQAWEDSEGPGDITHGATHWEGTKFKTPSWAKYMIVTLELNNQRFYKE